MFLQGGSKIAGLHVEQGDVDIEGFEPPDEQAELLCYVEVETPVNVLWIGPMSFARVQDFLYAGKSKSDIGNDWKSWGYSLPAIQRLSKVALQPLATHGE